MNKSARDHMNGLRSDDGEAQNAAFAYLMQETEMPVDWAYDIWDDTLAALRHKDGRARAIAAQVLCNLAKSDPKNRMLKDIDSLIAVTRDEKFVTARHTIQALWKIGLVGAKQRALVLDRLASRFADCASEKNCTLIRYDILAGLRQLFDATHDTTIKDKALALIATEADAKYQKKYATMWRKA